MFLFPAARAALLLCTVARCLRHGHLLRGSLPVQRWRTVLQAGQAMGQRQDVLHVSMSALPSTRPSVRKASPIRRCGTCRAPAVLQAGAAVRRQGQVSLFNDSENVSSACL